MMSSVIRDPQSERICTRSAAQQRCVQHQCPSLCFCLVCGVDLSHCFSDVPLLYGTLDQVPFLIDPNTGVSMGESEEIVRYLFTTYRRPSDDTGSSSE